MDSLVEIDRWWMLALGVALLLATLVDVAWTAIAAGVGRGPLTRLITGAVGQALTAGPVGRRRGRSPDMSWW